MGLYFAPYRWYNPSAARWLTRDPLGMADGPNVYAYVHGNPINRVDPLGLISFCWETTGKISVSCRYAEGGFHPVGGPKCDLLASIINKGIDNSKNNCSECKNKKLAATITVPDWESPDILIKGDLPVIGEVNCKCKIKTRNVVIKLYTCDDCDK